MPKNPYYRLTDWICDTSSRQIAYAGQMVDSSCLMFVYAGIDAAASFDGDSLDPDWLERYLITAGSIVSKYDGSRILIAPYPSRYGDLDQYGDGDQVQGITRSSTGDVITGKNGEDVCICYNTSSRLPDLDIPYYSRTLSDVDDAIDALIRWAKCAPIISAADSKSEAAINAMIDEIMDGKRPCVIGDETVLTAMQHGQTYSIDITDPKRATYIQYLSELHDVLIRRYYTKNGIDTHKTSKHAQVTTDETDGMEIYSWLIPLNKLEQRRKWCNAMNRLYNLNLSVDFAEPWKSAYDAYIKKLQNGGDQDAETPEHIADADDPDNNQIVD